jgi:hypothetical protein
MLYIIRGRSFKKCLTLNMQDESYRYAKIAKPVAPGVLQHVMGWGIKRRKIFLSDIDLNDFLGRLSALAKDGGMEVNIGFTLK